MNDKFKRIYNRTKPRMIIIACLAMIIGQVVGFLCYGAYKQYGASRSKETRVPLPAQEVVLQIEACWAKGKNAKIETSRWARSKVYSVTCTEKDWRDILDDRNRLQYERKAK